jgi:hypothetical protein
MSNVWKISSLNESNEQEFMLSIKENKLLHIFTLSDLKNAREKTARALGRRRQCSRGESVREDRVQTVKKHSFRVHGEEKVRLSHSFSKVIPQSLKLLRRLKNTSPTGE